MKTFINKYFWFLSATLFLILRLPSLFEPYWYGDEGIYLALGQGIRHGLQLYSQIHDNKPPLLYFLAALSHTVFGFRLLLFIVMIPTLYFFYKLSQKFLDKSQLRIAFILFLVLTSIPFLEGTIANAEVFMLLPTIAAVLLFLVPVSRFSPRLPAGRFLFSGLLLGIAFTLKIPVFAEMMFLALWLLISTKKFTVSLINIINFSVGCLIPIVLFALYYFVQDSFPDFLFASLLNNFGYLSSWQTGSHTSSPLAGGLMLRTLVLFIFWFILIVLHFRKIYKDKYLFLFGWFAATIYAALLSGRPYPHYLVQTLPPFCLLLASLFYSKLRSTKIFVISLLLVFLALIIKFKFYFYPVFSYYSNFTYYLLHLTDYNKYASYFSGRVVTNERIARYIKDNSSPSDRIFVWGDEPYIYPLSDRLPSGRFLVAYHIADFKRHQETLDSLYINFPKFIVTYPMDNRPYPQLFDFISNYYYPAEVFDNVIVYQRR